MNNIIKSLALIVGFSAASASASVITLMDENFESINLGAFVNEGGGDGTDYSSTGPAGWSKDNSGIVAPQGSNSIEYYGFTFLDIDSWIVASANQNRDKFTKGGVGSHGTVMVADPDEYDDQTSLGSNGFNAYITTNAMDLSGILDNSLAVAFDSSFVAYDDSEVTLDVSYDGGAFSNLLTYNTVNDPIGANSLARINEGLLINVGNTGASSVVFRFGLTNAGNDWWWAVDNIKVTGQAIDVPEPSTLVIFGLGLLGLVVRKTKNK